MEFPEEPEIKQAENSSQSKLYQSEDVFITDRIKKVGEISIKCTYHPPSKNLQGALVATLIGCKKLISSNKSSLASEQVNCYVCLEVVANGNRHCFLRWNHSGNYFKPKKYSKQTAVENLAAITRTQTVRSNNPTFNEKFILRIHPHSSSEPFFLDLNVWEKSQFSPNSVYIGGTQVFEQDFVHHKEVTIDQNLHGVMQDSDIPKK